MAASCWPLRVEMVSPARLHVMLVVLLSRPLASTHCHGRLVRWGDTSSQLPVRGLYLRCEMSSRILSGMVVVLVLEVECGVEDAPRWGGDAPAFKYQGNSISTSKVSMTTGYDYGTVTS